MKITIERKKLLTGHTASIFALEKALETNCFFSGDGRGWLVKWNLDATEQEGKLIAQIPSNIFSICLLQKEKMLAVGTMQGILYFIDLVKQEVITPSLQFSASIFDIKQKEKEIFIACGDGQIHMVSLIDKKHCKSIKVSDKSIRSLAFNQSKKVLFIACSDGHIYSLHTQNHRLTRHQQKHKNSVFALQYHHEKMQLIAGSRDAHLSVWQIENENLKWQQSLPAHNFTINSLAFSPNKKYLATSSRDKTIKIWNSANFDLLKVIDNTKIEMEAHLNSVNKLLWLNYKEYLISASDDRKIMVWKINE
ncbi:MAG: hypothetical protein ACPG5B_10355 [Chitinophagales bacterium]